MSRVRIKNGRLKWRGIKLYVDNAPAKRGQRLEVGKVYHLAGTRKPSFWRRLLGRRNP